MCIMGSNLGGLSKYNWDGDKMIHVSIVPSSRPVPGVKQKKNYDIDIREFLVTADNAVMRRVLSEDIKKYTKAHRWMDLNLFESRSPKSFDHRASVISAYVFEKIKYKSSPGRDIWYFPDETVTLGYGDCEDRAFLLASLLISSGISPYNVRVALGKIFYKGKEYDHMWVMYKNEGGGWMLLEPLLQFEHMARRKPAVSTGKSSTPAEYRPYFLFNNTHLWAVKQPGSYTAEFQNTMQLRKAWNKFNPKFAGDVHYSIVNEALGVDLNGNKASAEVQNFLNVLNSYFHSILGHTIDNVDSPRKYNPLEHFDNGLIDEAWNLIDQRLGDFKNVKTPEIFSLIAHGTADFYAHSSYAHFAPQDKSAKSTLPTLQRYSKSEFVKWCSKIDYNSANKFDLSTDQFSINTNMWQGKLSQRADPWKGKLLSGRYGQVNDHDRPGFSIFNPVEAIQFYGENSSVGDWDSVSAIKKNPNIAALPHHNEIAVDSANKESWHKLYASNDFKKQFELRRNTAVLHIRETFYNNWGN